MKRLVLLTTLILTLLSGLSLAEPQRAQAQTGTVDLIGQMGGGTNIAVFVQDNYAYIYIGYQLIILDITDPSVPVRVGQTDLLASSYRILGIGIYISGSYAYVADEDSGLQIINVSNPAAPTLIGSFGIPGEANDVVVSGNYAYVAALDNGLQIINVSNPAAPTLSGSYDTPGVARGVAVSGNYAYVADGGSGLQIINVSNPAAPTLIGSFDTGEANNVVVSGNYAYVADWSSGLQIINVSNPAAPTLSSIYDTPWAANDVVVSGNYAYVADGDSGLQIINVSNSATPILSGSYGIGKATGVVVSGNYAYVADSKNGLQIINVSNPTGLTISGKSYIQREQAKNVAVNGNYAYVAAGDIGLQIINVSNPADPILSGTYKTYSSGIANGVVVSGTQAYVGDWTSGLLIINVSNPTTPTLISSIDTSGSARGVAVSGNTVYVADGSNGLQIIGGGSIGWSANDVVISGTTAYVAALDNGLQIINVSNRYAPTLIGKYDTPNYAYGVTVSGNYAYVADGNSGLQIINVSNPAAPTLSGSYDTPGIAWDVAVSGNTVYVADDTGGLVILRFNEATPTPTKTNTPIATAISTSTNTPTATSTKTPTNTPIPPTATNTPIPPTATKTPILPTATNTPIPTPTPQVAPPDAYEIDNSCPEAKPIEADGVPQNHTFHAPNDQDWLAVQLTAGITYVVNVDVPANSQADVTAEIYSNCDTLLNPGQNPTFSPGIFYQLTPLTTGRYYLRLLNDLPDKFGSEMSYEVSVRPQLTQQGAGALVIVTGRRDKDDLTDLQTNLQTISKNVYQLWRSKGYPPERIYYLATNLELDLDGDKQADVNALANNTSLKYAITEWTKDKGLGPDRAFTLYLVDHGGRGGRFYLDKPRLEELQSEDLANWLTTLETQAPGVKVNVIIEACYSGGFISRNRPRLLTPLQLLSGPNRVIVTSADEVALAYASEEGGRFSDTFLSSLQQDLSLTEAFKQAKATARQYDPSQIAWLDGDGNGIPNQTSDFAAAALRGFSFSGSFADDKLWPPYIKTVSMIPQANGMVEIKAEIRDKETPDGGVTAWAVVYPPSYQPPTDSELMVESPVPASFLRRGNNQFAFSHTPFTEVGTYRMVIQAQDKDGLLSQPYQIEFGHAKSLLYLPLILK